MKNINIEIGRMNIDLLAKEFNVMLALIEHLVIHKREKIYLIKPEIIITQG